MPSIHLRPLVLGNTFTYWFWKQRRLIKCPWARCLGLEYSCRVYLYILLLYKSWCDSWLLSIPFYLLMLAFIIDCCFSDVLSCWFTLYFLYVVPVLVLLEGKQGFGLGRFDVCISYAHLGLIFPTIMHLLWLLQAYLSPYASFVLLWLFYVCFAGFIDIRAFRTTFWRHYGH